MKIQMIQVMPDIFVVQYTLDNGATLVAGRVSTEAEARAMQHGFLEGMNAVKVMIGNGPQSSEEIKVP